MLSKALKKSVRDERTTQAVEIVDEVLAWPPIVDRGPFFRKKTRRQLQEKNDRDLLIKNLLLGDESANCP